MATVTFLLRGDKNPSNIYIRLSAGRKTNLTRSTPLVINPKYFNKKTGRVARKAEYIQKDKMQKTLSNLNLHILDAYNETISKGNVIDSNWMKSELHSFFNISNENDLTYLSSYCTHFIKKARTQPNEKTGRPVKPSTIDKYTALLKKLERYEKHKNRKFKVSDVNLNFRKDFFINFLISKEGYHYNTVGRDVGILTLVCKSARRSGIKTSHELEDIKGWSAKKANIIHLDLKELEVIKQFNYDDNTLELAKDWLLLGCETGQRVSDIMDMGLDKIEYQITPKGRSVKVVVLKQLKGGKKVIIPITPPVDEILKKYNNDFPSKLSKTAKSSATIFNLKIKEVCKLAGINQMIEGDLNDPDTNRLKAGVYPKYKLISSHVCRRSYVSNYLGTFDSSLVMAVTGHEKERQMMDYNALESIHHLDKIMEYYEQKETVNKIKIAK